MAKKDLPYDTLDSDRPAADLYLRPDKASPSQMKNKHLSGDNGQNALQNWTSHMNDRRNTQQMISSK